MDDKIIHRLSSYYLFFNMNLLLSMSRLLFYAHFKTVISCPKGLILNFSVALLSIPTWIGSFFRKDRSKIDPF